MKNKKFNLFDLLVIILLLGIIAAVIFRSQITETVFGGGKQEYKVTFEVSAFSNEGIPSLAEGSVIYVHGNQLPFGKIASVASVPVTDTFVVGSEETDAASANFSSLTLVIEIEGHVADDVFYAKNGTPLLVRKDLSLENEDVCFNAKISSVEVISGN